MEADEAFDVLLILWTGYPGKDVETFCRSHDMPLLIKPGSLSELEKKVSELLPVIREKHQRRMH
jgi:hypothetical protein